ncbi:MAG: methylenetetrahydrofolate reductase [Elusimicrobiota bacterium]
MKISEIIKKKRTFSFEFFPPKEESQNESFAKNLKDLIPLKPDFVSVTDTGYSAAKYKHLALSMLLKEKAGFDVILHLTCLNSTKREIGTVLEKAKAAGIENILALRGDPDPNREILPGDFSYASDLIKEIDLSGFCAGAAAHPEKHPLSASLKEDMSILKMKADLGVSFFITQLFFDNSVFFRLRDDLAKNNISVPIIAGIMPLASPLSLLKIEEKTGKISKPKALIEIMEKYSNDKESFFKASVEFSINQCEELLSKGTNALHFFTFNKAKAVKEILGAIK